MFPKGGIIWNENVYFWFLDGYCTIWDRGYCNEP